MNYQQETAIKKVNAGAEEKMDRYGECMKEEVAEALKDFILQDEEFAQAVAQGGSFKECMAAVAKCVHGNYCSDMEAFGAAVAFFFPGARIKVTMKIDLIGDAAKPEEDEKQSGPVIIDLTDFF